MAIASTASDRRAHEPGMRSGSRVNPCARAHPHPHHQIGRCLRPSSWCASSAIAALSVRSSRRRSGVWLHRSPRHHIRPARDTCGARGGRAPHIQLVRRWKVPAVDCGEVERGGRPVSGRVMESHLGQTQRQADERMGLHSDPRRPYAWNRHPEQSPLYRTAAVESLDVAALQLRLKAAQVATE